MVCVSWKTMKCFMFFCLSKLTVIVIILQFLPIILLVNIVLDINESVNFISVHLPPIPPSLSPGPTRISKKWQIPQGGDKRMGQMPWVRAKQKANALPLGHPENSTAQYNVCNKS